MFVGMDQQLHCRAALNEGLSLRQVRPSKCAALSAALECLLSKVYLLEIQSCNSYRNDSGASIEPTSDERPEGRSETHFGLLMMLWKEK